jgi:hypothetical protein
MGTGRSGEVRRRRREKLADSWARNGAFLG